MKEEGVEENRLYLQPTSLKVLLRGPEFPSPRRYAKISTARTNSRLTSRVREASKVQVDGILGELYPEEKPVLQSRGTTTTSSSLRHTRLPPMSGPARNSITTLQRLLRENDTSISEQAILTSVLKLSTDSLFRLDVALGDAQRSTCGLSLELSSFLAEFSVYEQTQLQHVYAQVPQEHRHRWFRRVFIFKQVCQEAMVSILPKDSRCVAAQRRNKKHSPLSPLQMDHLHSYQTTRSTPLCLKRVYDSKVDYARELAHSTQHRVVIDTAVRENKNWIRDHCQSTIVSTLNVNLRKRFAVEKLQLVLLPYYRRVQARVLTRWTRLCTEWHGVETVRSYFRQKACLNLLQFGRRKYAELFFKTWTAWRRDTRLAQDVERFASAVVIQSLVRQARAKLRQRHEIRESSRVKIQYCWIRFRHHQRYVRHVRYQAFMSSALKIQHTWHRACVRSRLAQTRERRVAATSIQGCVRRYFIHLRWVFARKVVEHRTNAATRIQCWFRVYRARACRTRLAIAKREHAAEILQHAWRRYRLRSVIQARVHVKWHNISRAATYLQRMWRGKVAWRKLMQLIDQADARRRGDILSQMWNQSSAEKIQQWWRYQRFRQQRRTTR